MTDFEIKGKLAGVNGEDSTIDLFTVKGKDLMGLNDFNNNDNNKKIKTITDNDDLKKKLRAMVNIVHNSSKPVGDLDVELNNVQAGGSLIGTTTNNLIRPFTNTSNDARHIITNTIKSTLNTENLFNRRGLTGTKRFRSPFGKSKSRRNRRNTRSRK